MPMSGLRSEEQHTSRRPVLPNRPAATHLGNRKHDGGPPAPAEPSPPPAVQKVKLEPTSDDISLTKAVAIDCEMVRVGSDGSKSALGRVTLMPP